MKLHKISIHDFVDYVPAVLVDLYDNSSIHLFLGDDGYYCSDNLKSDKWFVGRNEADVIEYLAGLL